jgi:hypothetical protein
VLPRLCNGDRHYWRFKWRAIVHEKNLIVVLVTRSAYA